MITISTTNSWRRNHPDAAIGILEISSLDNRGSPQAMNAIKQDIETELRAAYAGSTRADFNQVPEIAAYRRYYKRFKKSYHVQLQLESIVLKGKALPRVSPLVDANFMAEVQSLVLTAGHDAGRLAVPVTIDSSTDDDRMTQMNGNERAIQAGDMVMRDAGGISCTIIYGQDNRSPITKTTTHALYVAYAPEGISEAGVMRHFDLLEGYIRLVSPCATVEQRTLLQAENNLGKSVFTTSRNN